MAGSIWKIALPRLFSSTGFRKSLAWISELKHIEKHFEAEEKILEQIGFPNYENHVAVHQSLLLRVSGLNRNCGNGAINTAAFYSFVVDDVVLGHLLEDDIKFFPYL